MHNVIGICRFHYSVTTSDRWPSYRPSLQVYWTSWRTRPPPYIVLPHASVVKNTSKLTFRRLMSTIVTYRTANLQSGILYIYSTNIGTKYFKHGIYSPIFPLQNAVCFIILTNLVPVLFTFYIQGMLK